MSAGALDAGEPDATFWLNDLDGLSSQSSKTNTGVSGMSELGFGACYQGPSTTVWF